MPECAREELELHARFVPKPLMMDAQTVDASAVWRYALSTVVQSKNVCALLHQLEYQATAWRPEDLSHDRLPCSSLHLEVLASYHFQGRQVWNLFRHASLQRLQQQMQHMRRDLPSLQKNWQESVPVTGISHILYSIRSKRPLAMASPVQHALYDS